MHEITKTDEYSENKKKNSFKIWWKNYFLNFNQNFWPVLENNIRCLKIDQYHEYHNYLHFADR